MDVKYNLPRVKSGTSFEDLGYSQFSETETYAAGDVVIYDGSLYKFTAAHTGAWTGEDAEATSINEQKADADKVLAIEKKTQDIHMEVTIDDAEQIEICDNDGSTHSSLTIKTEQGYAEEQRWESNDGSEVYAKIDKNGINGVVTLSMPQITMPNVVEPDSAIVDSGYSSPIGRNNVKRANWSAEDKYTYYDFLAHYYDCYLGMGEGYRVTKKSLGSDASNDGYELIEYDLCPDNYSKIVLLSAGMNTCETGAIWGLATFIKAVMTSNEAGFKFLRENVRFKVLPIICPSSFDEATLAYPNANGVRINKNFDWNRHWYDVVGETKGDYPDSEHETKILKRWLNDNAWKANLYIDCHQDPDKNVSQVNDIAIVICSDSATKAKLDVCFPSLAAFYTSKGYIPVGTTPNILSWVEGGATYPKTKYAKVNCGIPAIMIEQYCSSEMWGSDGNTINDTYGIKNYVTMLRLYILTILSQEKASVRLGNLSSLLYNI